MNFRKFLRTLFLENTYRLLGDTGDNLSGERGGGGGKGGGRGYFKYIPVSFSFVLQEYRYGGSMHLRQVWNL